MAINSRQAIVRWAACVLLTLVVAYPLSYAPVVKWEAARQYHFANRFNPPLIDGTTLPIYQPLDWLIDNTPVDKPMYLWASLWGVEPSFHESAYWRSVARRMWPPNGRINL